ncbi:DUF2339 domain-containing protein [Siminovitchia sp. FSL W7-1587]|uniref:DUF2339 domain-containing protein n=1 Tax=Siminovitchia sp. FSL W7-1587 TaxID=2954699 RepID=UPI0030D48590
MDENIKKLVRRVETLEEEVSTLKRKIAKMEPLSTADIRKAEVKESPQKTTVEQTGERMTAEPESKQTAAQTMAELEDKQIVAQTTAELESKQTVAQTTAELESKQKAQPVQMKQEPKKEVDFEKILGIWLPRVFMFILLLGVLWGLKVGMDNGWITYSVRIVMGYASTILLYYLGMRYVKGEKKLFGVTLLGGVIALGILTTFAAHYLYDYFHYMLAFIIGIFYIALGLFLSKKTKSETLTIFSAIAGFLLPFLLEGQGATALQFCLYILLLFLSLFYVSLSEKHKITFYVTFVLFHVTLMIYANFAGTYGSEYIIVATVLIQHISLLTFYIRGLISRQVFTEVLIYTNFVFAISWIKLLIQPQEVVVYGLFALLYIVLTAYVFSEKDRSLQGVLSAVAVFATSVFILSFQLEHIQVKLMLLLINGAIGLWVGLYYATKRTIVTSSIIYGITAWTVILTVYMERFVSYDHLVWLLLLITMGWIYHSIYRFGPNKFHLQVQKIDMSLMIGQIISLLYIFHLTQIWLAQTYLPYETESHIQALIFMAALLFMYFAYKWKHGVYVTYAAVIEYLVLGLVIVSLPLTDDFLNQWFLFHLFVEIGYVFLLTCLFVIIFKGKLPNKEGLKAKASAYFIALQVTCFIFLNKWYFAITNVYDWDREYVFLVHTFLLFLFAFLSISLGRKWNWKAVKIIGSLLIGFCLLKLFFIDLINISIIIRAILFIIVGVVGLLYSRTLLKD